MAEHVCPTCGYKTTRAYNLKLHLNKKTPCAPKTQNECCYECCFCSKKFKYKTHMYSHQKLCNISTQKELYEIKEDLRDEFERKLEEFKKEFLLNQKQTITNNTTTNNIQNNITIHAYGNESVSHINDAMLDRYVKRTNKGLVQLIEQIHFNPSFPQNANLRITNKKLPFIEYHNGDKWLFEKKDKIVHDLIDKSHNMMQTHFDDNEDRMKDSMNETMYEYVKSWLDHMRRGMRWGEERSRPVSQCNERNNDDEKSFKDVVDPVLADVYLLILNNTR